jgi:S1-C subfamily serine protease
MKRNTRLIATLAAALVMVTAGMASAQPQGPQDKDRSADAWVRVPQRASKPRLGVRLLEISSDLRAYFGAPADRGVLVDSVVAGSPAARAGLRAGDLVLVVDGDEAASTQDVLSALADRKKGASVAVEVLRDRKRTTLRVTMESDPGPVADLGIDTSQLPGFGPWPDDARRRLEEIEKRLDRLEKTR